MNVYQAIAWVQNSLQAVGKDSKVAAGPAKYSYRGIDAVINALHPLLGRAGLTISPVVESYHTEDHTWSNGKTEPKTVLQVRYRMFASDGTYLPRKLCPVGVGEGIDNTDKGPGKAMSYTYKTAISQFFSLPTDDPDMDNEHYTEPVAAHEVKPEDVPTAPETQAELTATIPDLSDEQMEDINKRFSAKFGQDMLSPRTELAARSLLKIVKQTVETNADSPAAGGPLNRQDLHARVAELSAGLDVDGNTRFTAWRESQDIPSLRANTSELHLKSMRNWLEADAGNDPIG